MAPSKNQEVKEENLTERPLYYKSLSGMPYLGRMDNARSISAGLFKILKKLEGKAVLTFDAGLSGNLGTLSFNHGLGFVPIVIGTIKEVGAEEQSISFPYSNGTEYGEIKSIDETKLELEFFAEFADKYEILIYLLQLPGIQ